MDSNRENTIKKATMRICVGRVREVLLSRHSEAHLVIWLDDNSERKKVAYIYTFG